jgi:hypothetical protein
MSKHRVVKSSFWTDDYIEKLPVKERYFFLYLLTNPNTNILGIYQATLKRIKFETDLSGDEIDSFFKKFSEDDKVHYISDHVLMVNFQKHQKPNQKMVTGMQSLYDCLPEKVVNFINTKKSRIYHRLSKTIKVYVYPHINKDINKDKNKNKNKNTDFEVEESSEQKTLVPEDPGVTKKIKQMDPIVDSIIDLSNELFNREGYFIEKENWNARDMIKLRLIDYDFEKIKKALEQAKSDYFNDKKMYKMCRWEMLFRDTTIDLLYKNSQIVPPEENKRPISFTCGRPMPKEFL